jgi:hypothetical protein
VKAASVTWEFSACQLVRFPDKHFRMWGKIYFGTQLQLAWVCMHEYTHAHTHTLFALPQYLELSVFKVWKWVYTTVK